MDKHNWYYRFLADTDWLNDHHQDIERSIWSLLLELTESSGVVYGFDVSQRGLGPNFSIDISSGVAYDSYGRRIINNSTVNLEFGVDEEENPIEVVSSGNERIVSVYAYYNTTDSSPAIDGFGDTVYQLTTEDKKFKLYLGEEAFIGSATPAPHPSDGGILLAHIKLYFDDLEINNSQINTTVKQELSILGDSSFVHDRGDEEIEGHWSFYNDSSLTFYSDDGTTPTLELDGATGNIRSIGDLIIEGTVDGVNISDHDHSGADQGGQVDHENLDNIGFYSHEEIDEHLEFDEVHFTEESIDHGSISGLNHDDHPQYANIFQREMITGEWTFDRIPTCGVTPSRSYDLANKSYVDAVSGESDHGALTGLAHDDHPQYLHLNKAGQTLRQNLAVADGVRVDGVNISAHTHNSEFYLSLNKGATLSKVHVNSANSDNTFSIEGGSSDFVAFSLCQIDLHNNNFSSDNQVRVGGTTYTRLGGFNAIDFPGYSAGNWNFRVYANAGNDDQVTCHWMAVLDITQSINFRTLPPR